MPDLFEVIVKRWKLIAGLTLSATILAWIISLFMPKEYVSVATALPANSLTADKARLFNNNIEALYSEIGLPDELDRMEGTALLDTIFIAAADRFDLPAHYHIKQNGDAFYKAVIKLKKNSNIHKSGYGELKVKVWDENPETASGLANALLQGIQQIHQHLQNERNMMVWQKVCTEYEQKKKQYASLSDSARSLSGAQAEMAMVNKTALLEQIKEYQNMIGQYQLAIKTNPPVLLTVEPARPSIWPDKPRILQTILITFFAALIFSYVLAMFLETRIKS
jgi:hypothetical protein